MKRRREWRKLGKMEDLGRGKVESGEKANVWKEICQGKEEEENRNMEGNTRKREREREGKKGK